MISELIDPDLRRSKAGGQGGAGILVDIMFVIDRVLSQDNRVLLCGHNANIRQSRCCCSRRRRISRSTNTSSHSLHKPRTQLHLQRTLFCLPPFLALSKLKYDLKRLFSPTSPTNADQSTQVRSTRQERASSFKSTCSLTHVPA